jgi:threonine dehydrogenase-like Zn-dependent dehydrogenase
MMKSFEFPCNGGSLVYVGLVRKDITFSDPLFHGKELTLMASRNATKEDFSNVIAGIESGRVNTSGFVTHTATMEQALKDFPLWLKPETGVIKALISIA